MYLPVDWIITTIIYGNKSFSSSSSFIIILLLSFLILLLLLLILFFFFFFFFFFFLSSSHTGIHLTSSIERICTCSWYGLCTSISCTFVSCIIWFIIKTWLVKISTKNFKLVSHGWVLLPSPPLSIFFVCTIFINNNCPPPPPFLSPFSPLSLPLSRSPFLISSLSFQWRNVSGDRPLLCVNLKQQRSKLLVEMLHLIQNLHLIF